MKKILITLVALTLVVGASFAQGLKLGHINSNQLLSIMPETKAADSVLQKFGTSLQNQLQTMNTEYEGKVGEYKKNEASMLDAVKEMKVKEITDLEDRIREFQQSAQENISKKKEEIYAPILKKAEEAIKGIAKEKGYTYIFDAGVGVLLYSQDSDDILPLVKAKLGLK
ncbi:MAG: OmpH family outer membrane protein [Bacteroidetes bacterium]|nr:OmpH family outer membrane protein [Bacteroidota bacterium]MBL0051653.1 OmpH family outer membrane protein [Bacteroidota bacterium]